MEYLHFQNSLIETIGVVLGMAGLAVVSVGGAEIARDIFHVLGHTWKWLIPHHSLHHRAFSHDMSAINPAIYVKSQWHHDIPEATVMLLSSIAFSALSLVWTGPSPMWFGTLWGVGYSMRTLFLTVCRGLGYAWATSLDTNHKPTDKIAPPASTVVNWGYHQRHHNDDPRAYYSGVFPILDKLLGTAMSLKGKSVVVTGASGALGTALIKQLLQAGAKVTALSSSQTAPLQFEVNDRVKTVESISWSVGEEMSLAGLLEQIDILVINHGVNSKERSLTAALSSFEVNTLSAYRLMNLFLQTVRSPHDASRKEVWVVTSEAEVAPARSPLYENSKRSLGSLVTLARLDAPCVVRKVVLGAFRSRMSPRAMFSANWMAKQVVAAAQRDTRNIVVSPVRVWIQVFFPIREWMVSRYYRRWSHVATEPEPSVALQSVSH